MTPPRTPATAQRGVALITAILVVAIATIAAAAMAVSHQIAVHRSRTLQESEMGWWYIEGVEQWVMTILQRDAETSDYDSLVEPWAQPVDYLPVDEGVLRGRVVDLQGRFNLNNLASADAEALTRYNGHFQRLYVLVGAGTDFEAAAMASVIRDWIDADQEPTGFDGAEETEYLGFSPPPTARPIAPMVDVGELMAVKGMTREIFELLRPHVTALPLVGSAVNVQYRHRAGAAEPGANPRARTERLSGIASRCAAARRCGHPVQPHRRCPAGERRQPVLHARKRSAHRQ